MPESQNEPRTTRTGAERTESRKRLKPERGFRAVPGAPWLNTNDKAPLPSVMAQGPWIVDGPSQSPDQLLSIWNAVGRAAVRSGVLVSRASFPELFQLTDLVMSN